MPTKTRLWRNSACAKGNNLSRLVLISRVTIPAAILRIREEKSRDVILKLVGNVVMWFLYSTSNVLSLTLLSSC